MASAYTATALNAALQAILDLADGISLHDGDPGDGSANEISGGSYARAAITEPDWTGPTAGEASLTAPEAFVCTALQAVTHFGLWDASVFLGKGEVTGDGAFNAAGEYNLDVTIDLAIVDDS